MSEENSPGTGLEQLCHKTGGPWIKFRGPRQGHAQLDLAASVCWCVRAHVPEHMRAESPAVRGMWQQPQEVLATVWKVFKQDWGYLSSGCMSTKKPVGLLTHQL